MRRIIDESIDSINVINSCNNKLPFVISIPHSGLYITKEMNDNLNDDIILTSSDWYLDELYSFLEDLGFTIVINNVNRYVIDPNRELVFNRDSFFNSCIYTKTTFLKDIYKTNLSKEDINNRINNYYMTYHNEIKKQIDSKLEYFDKVFLIDLHSFGRNIDKDIVLGDNNHNTMDKDNFMIIKDCFVNNGFTISENFPYRGGYITRKYGSNIGRCESIQIELSYRNYIENRLFNEEESPKINEDLMNECEKRLQDVFITLIDYYKDNIKLYLKK